MRCRVGLALLLAALGAAPAAAGDAPPPSVASNSNGFVPSYRVGVDTHWVKRYVLVRESYDSKTIEAMFDVVALLSAPAVQLDYHERHDGPEGPDRALGNSARIDVEVDSIAFTAEFQAAVRFTTQKVDANDGGREPARRWIATVAYIYLPAPRNVEDRRRNPWGFQVTNYRVDPESIAAGGGKP